MKHSDGNVLLFAKYIVKQKEIKAGGRLKQTTRQYTTDAFGRVTGITDNLFGSHTYTYDKRGFLTSADGETYEYDANGNITKLGNTVLTYDSVMKDRLASVDGKTVSYATDSSICPTSWDGKTFKFEGRRLVQYNATNRIKFVYNDMGLRTKKQVYSLKVGLAKLMYETDYFYDGDRLITEIRTKIIANRRMQTRLDYLYDENGMLYGFVYDKNSKYFYVRDVLQNILGIIDSDGDLVVQYTYNAWGKLLSTTGALATTIGANNPFRFKGYYYDTETGMYYCQSRYYVPEWGRWLCGDHPYYLNPSNLAGINLFAYCANDPINNIDPSGMFSWFIFAVLTLSTIAGAAYGGVKAKERAKAEGKTGKELFWATFKGVLLGGATGLAIGGAIIMIGASTKIIFCTLFARKALAAVTFAGMTALKAVAIGALFANIIPMVIAPLYGKEMEAFRTIDPSDPTPIPGQGPIHPGYMSILIDLFVRF